MGILYASHFQLHEAPFSIAPNPRFLFMSEQHREALAHLLYGIEHDGGFVLLTGEVGTGKTTLCRCLLEKTPADVDVAFIINPRLSVVELLSNICDELGIEYAQCTQSNRLLVDAINRYLLARHAEGRKIVLIIDEAQNLDSDVLEQLRLLTNLETDERKLLQIILLGQPELQQKLAHADLRQLSQRITARYHLQALNRDETNAYIAHRLSVAGCDEAIFSTAARRHIQRISQGIPRLINLICDRAMLGAYAGSVKKIDRKIIRQACREVLGEEITATKHKRWKTPLMASGFAAIALFIGLFIATSHKTPPPAVQKITQTAHSQTTQSQSKPLTHQINMTTHEKTAKPWAWPAEIDTVQSRETAFRALFKAWNITLPDSLEPCAFAAAQGLACLQQIGDLGRLRSLNRPAILAWQNSAGDVVYLAVLSLNGDAATATIGDKQVRIPLPVLRQHWMETFTLLWRTPEAYSGDLLPGTAGPSAKWLNGKLAMLEPALSVQRIAGIYQGNWVRRLRQFQRDTGLPPDGAAGPQTLIRLNTALHLPGPRLLPEATIVTPAEQASTGNAYVVHP